MTFFLFFNVYNYAVLPLTAC